MEKLQMVMNMDGTLCLDLYSEAVFSGNFPGMLGQYCDYVEQQTEKQVRRHPFRVGTCNGCGHVIVSNRDRGTEFKCQNCGKAAVLQELDTVEAKHVLQRYCELREIRRVSLAGQYADILVILPNDFSESQLLRKILHAYGFTPKEKQGESYVFLVSIGLSKGWINKTHNMAAYARTELMAQDESYGDLIPRVEELDRCIRRNFQDTYTISNLVPVAEIAPKAQSREEIEAEIRRLVAEGKMEEALELSRKLQ